MARDDPEATLPPPGRAPAGAPAELPRGANLGRYVILEKLGAGGMGAVYAAYDSSLDRKVAVKVLRPETSGEELAVRQERLLREARAMARLSHPNVNTVFDVGAYQGRLYLAMELVDGTTLRGWLAERPRAWREVADVFLQAGQGLLAAHRAGLVHRDVKPDNLLVGRDGRVRVTDFGLVASGSWAEAPEAGRAGCSQAAPEATITRTAGLAGSPAYMAPEQLEGGRASPASDQFSFCVALHEALTGTRPFAGASPAEVLQRIRAGQVETGPEAGAVPAFLLQAVRRGLAADPAARHPDLESLLAELARDPARARRRALGWTGAALALLLGGLGLLFGLRGDPEVCAQPGRPLRGVWDEAARSRVQAAFASTGRPQAGATFTQVARRLDAYARDWTESRRQSCEATHLRGEQSDTLFELRARCLDRRLSELGALVALLGAEGAGDLLDRAVQATFELTPIEACARAEELLAQVPLPENPSLREAVEALRARLDEVEAQVRVGRHLPALEAARGLAREASALGYPAVEAEALLLLGDLQSKADEQAEAEASLRAAGLAAARAGDDPAQAQALTRLIQVVGNLEDRRREALAMAPAAEMAVARAGGDALLEARLLSSLGVVQDLDGKYAEAQALHERALAIYRRVHGDTHPEVATAQDNLGVVLKEQGRHDQAIEHYRAAHAIREALLDPRHPDLGNALNNLGVVLDEQDKDEEALGFYRRALEIWTASLGTDNPRVAMVTNNIGSLYADEGRPAEGLPFYEQSLAIRVRLLGEKHQYTLRVRENIAMAHEAMGQHARAFEEYRELLALNRAVLGERHPGVAFTLNRLGLCHLRRGERAEAEESFRQALAIYEQAGGPEHLDLAEPLANLGRVLASRGRFDQARAQVERALALAERAYGPDHPGTAEARLRLGAVLRLAGKSPEAIPSLERGLAVLEARGRPARLLSEARFELARALWDGGGDRGRARELGARAWAAYRAAPDADEALSKDMAAWVEARGPGGAP